VYRRNAEETPGVGSDTCRGKGTESQVEPVSNSRFTGSQSVILEGKMKANRGEKKVGKENNLHDRKGEGSESLSSLGKSGGQNKYRRMPGKSRLEPERGTNSLKLFNT